MRNYIAPNMRNYIAPNACPTLRERSKPVSRWMSLCDAHLQLLLSKHGESV